jgi:hypothetical protein
MIMLYTIHLSKNISISKTFNVFIIYPYYGDELLYSNLSIHLRSSFSQIKGTNVQCLADSIMD